MTSVHQVERQFHGQVSNRQPLMTPNLNPQWSKPYGIDWGANAHFGGGFTLNEKAHEYQD